LTKDIQREAHELECEFYDLMKERNKLKTKK
jgi:hypothetical protein